MTPWRALVVGIVAIGLSGCAASSTQFGEPVGPAQTTAATAKATAPTTFIAIPGTTMESRSDAIVSTRSQTPTAIETRTQPRTQSSMITTESPQSSTTSPKPFVNAAVLASPSNAGRLAARDRQLLLDGQFQRFVGINAPGAADTNLLVSACGGEMNVDELFASLPQNSLVRVWFTQRLATRGTERAWYGFDRVVNAAELSPRRPHLVVTLGTGSGDCDEGHWKDEMWYATQFRQHEPGLPDSYRDFVAQTVTRYAGRSVIAMWEPINEPDAGICAAPYTGSQCYGHTTCSATAGTAFVSFMSDVSAMIKRIDPATLVSTGGTGWCGWDRATTLAIYRLSSIDVISVHLYSEDAQRFMDAVQATLRLAILVGKPWVVGEIGMLGGTGQCRSIQDRASDLRDLIRLLLVASASAVLPWHYAPSPSPECAFAIARSDPIWSLLGHS